jgi:hypothetical protein
LYTTLNFHEIDNSTVVLDGSKHLPVPAGWQIADGNADDIRVCGVHPWQSRWLVFDNGKQFGAYGTALNPNSYYKCRNSLLKHRKILRNAA